MKYNKSTRRKLQFKYALAMVLLGLALTAMALPAVAENPDSVSSLLNQTIVIDELVVKSTPIDTVALGYSISPSSDEDALSYTPPEAPKLDTETPLSARDTLAIISGYPRSIYSRPLSWTYSEPWWHGMWINTAVLSGAFIGTLFVLELLPQDATAWNRAELNQVPFYKRWFENIFKKGPHWDNDLFIFNYVLHPYAGAAYFMSARTCGFNFWQSMLYSAAISTFCWEFGVEACMERPSYQDIFVTPIIGSLFGEGLYRLKRLLVNNNYELLGSPVLGHIAGFFLDPVNEVVGLLSRGNCRTIGPGCLTSQPLLIPSAGSGASVGFSISATF